MKIIDDYLVGHLEGSVRRLAVGMAERISSFEYAIVRSVDSNMELMNWKPHAQLTERPQVLGNALLVSGASVVAMARSGDFTGFDEVWFVRRRPAEGPPRGTALVGPVDFDVDDVQLELAWAKKLDCELAVGDGIGLNYIARTRELQSLICKAMC